MVYLSLGSNVGDREAHLHNALALLESLGSVRAISSFYETEPVEFTDQAWFLNCAIELQTDQTPSILMASLLKIEQKMGRKRLQKKGPRTIDIDILLFGDTVMNTPELTIPHPAMAKRRFVLQPLAEIAPGMQHPTLKKTMQRLLEELPAGQEVCRVQPKINDQPRTTNDRIKAE